MERIIFLREELTPELANVVIAQLLYLNAENKEKDIFLYINIADSISSDGSVSAAMAIYDTMTQISCDVCTVPGNCSVGAR